MIYQMTGFEVFGNKITVSLTETAGLYLEYHTKTTFYFQWWFLLLAGMLIASTSL